MMSDNECYFYDEDWITYYYYLMNLKHWLIDSIYNEATDYYQFNIPTAGCQYYQSKVKLNGHQIVHFMIYKDSPSSPYFNSTNCFTPNDEDFKIPTNCISEQKGVSKEKKEIFALKKLVKILF